MFKLQSTLCNHFLCSVMLWGPGITTGFVLNVNLLDSNTLQGHILKDFIFNKD
jgi:hypothetical protein